MGGLAIRVNVPKDSYEIFNNLIGKPFEELKESELFSQDRTKRFDTRLENCFSIYRTDRLSFIINSKLASSFFEPFDQALIKKVSSIFENPPHLFAFEEYDSGNSYGYSFVVDGNIPRTFRSLNGEAKQFGDPQNIELKWLQAKRADFIDDEEVHPGFINPNNNQIDMMHSLPNCLFTEVFFHEIGFSTWDISTKSIATKHFRLC